MVVFCGTAAFVALFVLDVPGFLEAGVRAKVAQAKTDMRSLATALRSYFTDNSYYPPWDSGSAGANGHLDPEADAFGIPTFRVWTAPPSNSPGDQFRTLTTPISYIRSYLADPFAGGDDAVYGYYQKAFGWVLFSPGPDREYDLTLEDLEEYYDPEATAPSPEFLARFAYDPTNGTGSRGDLILMKP